MKEKPFGDKEVDCDDTDAPCVLIWNGNEWVPRKPGLELDLDEENSSQKINKFNISTVISATLDIFISRNIFEDVSRQNMLLPFVTNLFILVVLATIFTLVTFIEQFQYESNILSFNCFITMIAILVCYGLFSILLQKLQKTIVAEESTTLFIIDFLNMILSAIITVALPLAMFLLTYLSRNNYVYFYTLSSNENITEIKTFPVQMNHEISVNINQVYLFDEIMWNIDTASHNNYTDNNIKLVFCDDSFKCDNLKVKHAMIHFDSNNVFRQSSPYSIRNIEQFSISELYNSVKELGHVYFSNSELTIEHITHVLNCTRSLSISFNEIAESDQDNCRQEKFLNYYNKIAERKCLKFNDQIEPLDIVCGRNQQLNEIAFLNKNMYLKKNYLSFPTGLGENFCCINSSHFVEYYGECSYKLSFDYLDRKSNYYETPNCPVFNHRKHSLVL